MNAAGSWPAVTIASYTNLHGSAAVFGFLRGELDRRQRVVDRARFTRRLGFLASRLGAWPQVVSDPHEPCGVAPPVVLEAGVYVQLDHQGRLDSGVLDGFAGQLPEPARRERRGWPRRSLPPRARKSKTKVNEFPESATLFGGNLSPARAWSWGQC
jgi:hypothetical protein